MIREIRNGLPERIPVRLDFTDKVSMTKQSFKDECDINNIMRKYQKNALVTHLNQYQGQYADVTGAVDYHTAMNVVTRAHSMFMTLPAELRKDFGNDPARFLDFATDPANEEKLVEMGLKKQEVQRGEVPTSSSGTRPAQSNQAAPAATTASPPASGNAPAPGGGGS